MLLHGTRCLLVWVLLDDTLKSAVSTLVPWKDALLHDDAAHLLSNRSNRIRLSVQAAEAPRPESTTTTAGNGAGGVPASPRTTNNPITPTAGEKPRHERDVPIDSVARGRALLLQGSFREAAVILEQAVSTNAAEPAALLFLAEAYQALGQPRRTVELVDQLLALDVPVETKSFVLNRRGICLRRIGDLAGARESYELAVRDGLDNRHAMYNLAHLLHYAAFPRSPHDFSILLRAIELYRGALGRPDSGASVRSPTLQAAETGGRHASATLKKGARESTAKSDEIGGPLDTLPVLNDLSDALVQAGRPGEAASELEHALALVTGWLGSGGDRGRGVDAAHSEGHSKEEAFLWDTLRRARDDAGDHVGAVAAGNATYTEHSYSQRKLEMLRRVSLWCGE